MPDAVSVDGHDGSLAGLIESVPPVRPGMLGQDLYDMFAGQSRLYATAVVDAGGRPVGVVNRFRFLEALSRPTGRERYTHRPLESFMEQAPLIVDEHTPLDVVADLLMDDATKYIFDGFIVTRAGRYLGMGTGFSLMRCLTERKQATLLHVANHDVLTDLPNRQLFAGRLDRAMAQSLESGRIVAVLALDLDRFKGVNDRYGHEIGDLLLLGIASRLNESVGTQDTVARLGGDEFAVILSGLSDARDAEAIAAKLIRRCTEPHCLEGHEVNVSYSIGIAVFPDDAQSAEALLRAADDAVCHAKDVRNTWQRYSPDLTRPGNAAAFSLSSVTRGLSEGHLEVFYQPIVDFRSGMIGGVEALARWRDPVHGLLSTPDLIEFAEETGLIVEIGERIMLEAMRTVSDWKRTLAPHLELAVNVSGVQFREGGLVAMLERCLAETGFPAESLELEITESTVMRMGSSTYSALSQLKHMGIQVSIDDFGTGYSSLSRLQRLPVDALKIDRSFVQTIDAKGQGGEIATAVIVMAHSLGLSVTAEGVETRLQFGFLASEGCDRAQGYLFSRPVPAEELEAQLQMQVTAAGFSA
jgi:diguanylate cyclase (GGDEF)-like protein